MRVLHAGGLRVFERFFSVLRTGVRVALFSMRPGAFGMFDRFFDVFIARQRHPAQQGHTGEQSYHAHNRHSPTSLHHGLLHLLRVHCDRHGFSVVHLTQRPIPCQAEPAA